MFKISVMHVQTFYFSFINILLFSTFSLPSPSSLPKIANNDLLAELFKKKNYKITYREIPEISPSMYKPLQIKAPPNS